MKQTQNRAGVNDALNGVPYKFLSSKKRKSLHGLKESPDLANISI